MTPENEKWSRSLFLGRPILLRPFLLAFFALCFSLHGHPSFLPFDFNFVAIFFPLTFFLECGFCRWSATKLKKQNSRRQLWPDDGLFLPFLPFLSFLPSFPFAFLLLLFFLLCFISFSLYFSFPFSWSGSFPFCFFFPFFFFPFLFLFLCFPISFPFSFPVLFLFLSSFSFPYTDSYILAGGPGNEAGKPKTKPYTIPSNRTKNWRSYKVLEARHTKKIVWHLESLTASCQQKPTPTPTPFGWMLNFQIHHTVVTIQNWPYAVHSFQIHLWLRWDTWTLDHEGPWQPRLRRWALVWTTAQGWKRSGPRGRPVRPLNH